MTTHSKSELSSILKKSEAHTKTCTIDNGITSCNYRVQVEKGFLTISVSSKMVKTAIKVFERFLLRMFKEGFSLTLDCDTHFHCPASAIIVDGEQVPVRLKEKRDLKRNYNGWGYNQYVPNGILVFDIYGGTSWNPTKVLMKAEGQEWEDAFDDIIPYLHIAAKRIKANRLEAEDWHRKMEEEERLRQEHEQAIEDRASIVKSIVKDIWLFDRAETIRRYCDMAEQRNISDDYLKKIEVARQIADWLDPTVDYEDELLSERYKPTSFLG